MSHDKTDDRDRSDTLDLYNEELARKAVGSLFDDEEDDNNDETEPDGRYVTGFDKPAPERKPRARDSARDAYDRYDDDAYEDDDPETTVYAYRKRERSASTPPPRPAVKVNVASASSRTARGTHSQNRARPVTSRNEYDDYEDDYEAFRPRDKKRTAEPSARYERPVERTVERGRIERLDRADRSDRAERAERTERTYNDYDSEPASPVRWVAAALTFVFLIILAFLVYRISVISGELKEARATIAATTANDAELNELKVDNEALQNQIDAKDAEIERLMSGQPSSQAGDAPQTPVWQTDTTDDNPDTTVDTQPPASSENTLPTVYTVESRDNLSKISTKFYGNANPSNIKKIKDANNLTSDNISIGQKLTIPE